MIIHTDEYVLVSMHLAIFASRCQIDSTTGEIAQPRTTR
jgi:hypothetical protein